VWVIRGEGQGFTAGCGRPALGRSDGKLTSGKGRASNRTTQSARARFNSRPNTHSQRRCQGRHSLFIRTNLRLSDITVAATMGILPRLREKTRMSLKNLRERKKCLVRFSDQVAQGSPDPSYLRTPRGVEAFAGGGSRSEGRHQPQ